MKLFQDDSLGKLIIRLTLGIMLLFHGVAKLMNPDSLGFISGLLKGAGLPEELAYGVYIGEIAAPLMLIMGIFSRTAGFIVVVNMLFALWLAHTEDIFSLTPHGGWGLELQGFYLFTGLAILFLGSGRYAVKPG